MKIKLLEVPQSQIHAYLFGGLYDFAEKIRQKTLPKEVLLDYG